MGDQVESFFDFSELSVCQDACLSNCVGPGDGSLEIVRRQAPIDADRRIVAKSQLVRFFTEATAPKFHLPSLVNRV